jgi:host factor-I protein
MKTSDPNKTRSSKAAPPSLQDAFLDDLIRNRTRVTIFLMNGAKIEGELKSFDRHVILMRDATDKIYKHAISTIVPVTDGPAPTTTIVQKKAPSRLSARRTKA